MHAVGGPTELGTPTHRFVKCNAPIKCNSDTNLNWTHHNTADVIILFYLIRFTYVTHIQYITVAIRKNIIERRGVLPPAEKNQKLKSEKCWRKYKLRISYSKPIYSLNYHITELHGNWRTPIIAVIYVRCYAMPVTGVYRSRRVVCTRLNLKKYRCNRYEFYTIAFEISRQKILYVQFFCPYSQLFTKSPKLHSPERTIKHARMQMPGDSSS